MPETPCLFRNQTAVFLKCSEIDCALESVKKPRTAGLCGQVAGACDCGLLSCALIEWVNKGLKPPKQGMVRRKKLIPKDSFLHRRSSIHTDFSHSRKRRNVRFKGLRRVHTPPQPLTAHTPAHTAKHGAFRTGALSLPSVHFARFGNPARPGIRTANFAAFGPWSDVFPKNAESLRNSDALMRVAVSRRRGPAGLRDPIAVSLTAPMGFAVLSGHDNSMQRKILAGFTRWSVPCVLPLAAVPLLCPQHPSAADKTGRWKTGWAGSCRADFRFACARPA